MRTSTKATQLTHAMQKQLLERKRPKDKRVKTDPNKVPQTSSCLQITHNEWLGEGLLRCWAAAHADSSQTGDALRTVTSPCHLRAQH